MRLIDLDVSGECEGSQPVAPLEAAERHTADVTSDLLAHPRLRKLATYLETHTARRLTTAAAARIVCFQENYFCALFKRQTGWTFVSWQRTWRVERIAALLLSEQISISRAAERYGYLSMRTFERAFKSVYHVSAREFRRTQAMRAAPENPDHGVNGAGGNTCAKLCAPLPQPGLWLADEQGLKQPTGTMDAQFNGHPAAAAVPSLQTIYCELRALDPVEP